MALAREYYEFGLLSQSLQRDVELLGLRYGGPEVLLGVDYHRGRLNVLHELKWGLRHIQLLVVPGRPLVVLLAPDVYVVASAEEAVDI